MDAKGLGVRKQKNKRKKKQLRHLISHIEIPWTVCFFLLQTYTHTHHTHTRNKQKLENIEGKQLI